MYRPKRPKDFDEQEWVRCSSCEEYLLKDEAMHDHKTGEYFHRECLSQEEAASLAEEQ